MLIGAVQKFSTLDFPGKISCIVFTPGCNFRCGYCHNPEFVLPTLINKIRKSFISEDAFFNFLQERRGKLEAVVITGGEPTLMPDLISFMQKIKNLGFLVKLDSNGNRPQVLKDAITSDAVDYIAMDVKTSLPKYKELVGPLVNTNYIEESVKLIKKSQIQYEFRTTLVKEIHPQYVLNGMAELMDGAKNLYLQNFRPGYTLYPAFKHCHPFDSHEIEQIADLFRKKINNVHIRL